jgi:hypothetical protein
MMLTTAPTPILSHESFALGSSDERSLTARSYILTAEIRRSIDTLMQGDYLTTVAHPWSPNDSGDRLLAVTRI